MIVNKPVKDLTTRDMWGDATPSRLQNVWADWFLEIVENAEDHGHGAGKSYFWCRAIDVLRQRDWGVAQYLTHGVIDHTRPPSCEVCGLVETRLVWANTSHRGWVLLCEDVLACSRHYRSVRHEGAS